jgi:hypothetical protein
MSTDKGSSSAWWLNLEKNLANNLCGSKRVAQTLVWAFYRQKKWLELIAKPALELKRSKGYFISNAKRTSIK